jgi:proline iminopeptidase
MTPDSYTNNESFIDVGDGHSLYVQDWGNPKSKRPIVFLHGGPGGGCKDRHKQGFDPDVQRVIFFDQRGSGKSLPFGSVEHNTIQELVDDIEKIRDYLKLQQVILTGTSWGSTLALAYALSHPQHILSMVLGGIFTGSQDEIDWLLKGEFRAFYPDSWEYYLDSVPKSHRNDPSAYHFKRALTSSGEQSKQSAYAYHNLEASILNLDDRFVAEKFEDFDPSSTTIEMYYLNNRCFLPDRYILDNAGKIGVPVYLVQGRYDNVCPPLTAYALHRNLPDSRLTWVTSNHRSEHENWNIMRTILFQLTEAD